MAMKKATPETESAPHPDHAGGSVTTTDHDQIRAWAEARGGKPAAVGGTGSGNDVGLIRLEFPGATDANDANLAEIPWDEFFQKFEDSGLALVFQEQTAAGEQSNFNKLVKRESSAPSAAKRPAAKKAAAKKAVKKGSVMAKKVAKKAAPPKPVAKKGTAAKKSPVAKKAAAKKTVARSPLRRRRC